MSQKNSSVSCNHNQGFHCTQCWPKDLSITEESINQRLIPDFAAAKTDPDHPYVLMAQLCTKDGRKVGNGYISAIEHKYGLLIHTVVTDAGNQLRVTVNELKELFHPPELILSEKSND